MDRVWDRRIYLSILLSQTQYGLLAADDLDFTRLNPHLMSSCHVDAIFGHKVKKGQSVNFGFR